MSSRGKKTTVPASKKRKGASSSTALLTTDPWELFFGTIEPTYLELTIELCSTFHLQTIMMNYNDPGTVQFRLEEFKEENELHALSRHIHFSPSKCWHTLAPSTASYNPSRSKASVLPPSLRYLHAILAHTITGRQESTGVVNTHWPLRHRPCLFHRPCHSTLDGAASEGMSPQGISGMLSMRMIERHRGTYPPQYRLTQSTEEEAYEDIPDDVPPQHDDPPTQLPPPFRPVHAAASYADISKRFTRFEQTDGLMKLYDRWSILLHSRTESSPELQFEEFII
ncbi:hypothetical protein GOBAR_AA19420 [Gossypium barbadense]|uniref:Uncharacterized protein n=1 Tax=Gossypium barbadense TaxID=3634 RepID=A0A2P5XD36_GOSBA|nr:hypothetical protein GOBAR_AA19420 [Gossypium barbadense]